MDATPIAPQPSGVGFHLLNLIQALIPQQISKNSQPDFQLGLSYQPSFKDWVQHGRSRQFTLPDIVKQHADSTVIPLPVRLTNLLYNVPNWSGPYFERSLHAPDIIHGTNFSVYPRQKARTLLTIYDLTCWRYPHYVDAVARGYGDRLRQCLPWTDGILTISEHAKRDIVEFLGVDPDQVYVSYLASRYSEPAAGPSPEPPPDSALDSAIAVDYDFTQPYILFVSTLEPRKNVVGLVQAFNRLKQTLDIPHRLVLVGRKGWDYQPIFAEIARSPWTHHINHLDYLSDAAVAWLYRRAAVFAFPSHYEGFGLPVLEAMTLGAPVVTSNTSSLPEVAGDAAILVDPDDVAAIADGIAQVLQDPQLRDRLIQRGRQQARRFSWESTALATLKAYRGLLA